MSHNCAVLTLAICNRLEQKNRGGGAAAYVQGIVWQKWGLLCAAKLGTKCVAKGVVTILCGKRWRLHCVAKVVTTFCGKGGYYIMWQIKIFSFQNYHNAYYKKQLKIVLFLHQKAIKTYPFSSFTQRQGLFLFMLSPFTSQ